MRKECAVCLGVSLHHVFRKDAGHFQVIAFLILGSGETLHILLHPCGGIGHEGVLESAEPNEDHLHVIFPGGLDDIIHFREIVLSFSGFHKFP